MGDGISGISSRPRQQTDDGCDESTGICGARKSDPGISHAGDLEELYPPAPKVDPAKTAEIARNMAAANGATKLDELTWTALRKRIADLETSKSDPTQLAACKHELERREGIAAENRDVAPKTNWGSSASGQIARGSASGNVSLVTNSHGTVTMGNMGGSVGTNNEVNGAALRITKKTTDGGTTTVEVGSGKLSAGVLNSDGSVGFHVAAQGNVVAVEHTEQTKEGASATGGLSIGEGFELSFGFKDDGICMRAGVGPFTLGGCTTAPGAQASWGDDGSKK